MDVLRFTTALSGSNSNSTSATNLSPSSTPSASPSPARRGPGLMSMLFGSNPGPLSSPSTGIKRVAAPSSVSDSATNGNKDDEGRRSPLRVASCDGPMMTPAMPRAAMVAPTAATAPVAHRVHVPVMRKLW